MNKILVAGVVIEKDGKFLLVQEKQQRAYGLWNLPAGRNDVGETLEETAVREAKEESGFDVKTVASLGTWQDYDAGAELHAFRAEIIGGELNWPKDEILDAKWFSLLEIEEMRKLLRHPWVLESIKAI